MRMNFSCIFIYLKTIFKIISAFWNSSNRSSIECGNLISFSRERKSKSENSGVQWNASFCSLYLHWLCFKLWKTRIHSVISHNNTLTIAEINFEIIPVQHCQDCPTQRLDFIPFINGSQQHGPSSKYYITMKHFLFLAHGF